MMAVVDVLLHFVAVVFTLALCAALSYNVGKNGGADYE